MKKRYAIAGMAVGIVIALLGVLLLTGAITDSPVSASSAPYSYDSGYASFGADFYTYVSNNAAEAASAGRTAASNLIRVFDMIQTAAGIFLIGFGLMGTCFFGMQLEENKPHPAESVSDAPEEEQLPEI